MLEILDIKQTKRYWKYLEFLDIEISIINLELLGIYHQSVLDFQMRFFYELGHLLLTNRIYINKNDTIITYIFRINDYYALNNLSKIKPLGDFILNDFPFKYCSKKRKIVRQESFQISKKFKHIKLDEDIL
jgi:hypothetical protein